MNFKRMFQPKSMAVIGISLTNERHPANVIFHKNNLRYPVKVFPVNPKGGYLQNEKVFKSIEDIDEKIDLAIIAVKAEHCPAVLAQCINSGIGGCVVVSGGFAEVGRKDLEDRMVSMAIEADIPFIGPNCLGAFVPFVVDSFFLPSERMVRPDRGNVAIVSQSGGVLVDQMVKFASEGVGLSLAVSIGNKSMIKEIELLEYLRDDPNTNVISFYIEGFGRNEGREFVLAAAECPKPVIVMKAGKSLMGKRAVSSHTASLAGDYDVFSSVLSQHGIVEAKNEFELVAFCEALSCYPRAIEGKMGIITGSGGHGALAVDACSEQGLTVPLLDNETQNKIKAHLTSSIKDIASLGNPIDLTGSASDDDFVTATNLLSRSPEIECILLLLLPYLPGITSDLGAKLSLIYRQTEKPLVAYVPHVDKYGMLIEGFELNRIPVSQSIEGAIHMAEAMRRCNPC